MDVALGGVVDEAVADDLASGGGGGFLGRIAVRGAIGIDVFGIGRGVHVRVVESSSSSSSSAAEVILDLPDPLSLPVFLAGFLAAGDGSASSTAMASSPASVSTSMGLDTAASSISTLAPSGSVTSDLDGPFGAPADASALATFLLAATRAAVAPPFADGLARGAESAPIARDVCLGRSA